MRFHDREGAAPFYLIHSFPCSAWERTLATLYVAAGPYAAAARTAKRPDVHSHAERGREQKLQLKHRLYWPCVLSYGKISFPVSNCFPQHGEGARRDAQRFENPFALLRGYGPRFGAGASRYTYHLSCGNRPSLLFHYAEEPTDSRCLASRCQYPWRKDPACTSRKSEGRVLDGGRTSLPEFLLGR